MEPRQGISRSGDSVEKMFLRAVPDARRSDVARRGDAVLSVDDLDCYIEIKKADSAQGTINQIRPIKYIPCVVWAPQHGGWHVISACDLVKLGATKSRGQHSEVPFECLNASIRSVEEYCTKCDDKELANKMSDAIRRGRAQPQLEQSMQRLYKELRQLCDKYVDEVKRACL